MKYTWASATDAGHVREKNEDSVFPETDGHRSGPVVIAVADGMGGAAAGEVASKLAIEAATGTEGSAGERIRRGNEAVLEAEAADNTLSGMGTTLTIGLFEADGHLELGHVGDSRTYLLRKGELRQVTRDHTLVGEMVEQGRLTPTQAETHPRRHLLTRVIGMAGVTPDIIEMEIESGDRLLFCSDGLNLMLTDVGIARLLGGAADPSDAAWSLVEAANAAGGLDNVTVVVVDATA